MSASPQPQLAPRLRALLRRLRWRIRRYVALQGLAITVAVLGLAFWAALAVDWVFEPPAAVRRILLGAGALAGACAFYRYALRRLFARLGERNLAMLLERRYGRFEESLLTAVELTRRAGELPDYGREMLAHTCDEALAKSDQVELGEVFNRAPLARAVTAACVLAISIVALALAAPSVFQFGVRRLATLTDEPWPRKTRLVVEGFNNNVAVIARGTDLEVLVKADARADRVVPRVVQVRYRTDEGVRGRENMVKEGEAVPGRDPFQDFRYTFQGVLSPIRFDVLGGDARLGDLRIHVVDSPTISMVLGCQYPPYMSRLPADVPGAGMVALPLGTRVTVKARGTKDLVSARVDVLSEDASPETHTIDVGGRRQFEFVLDSLLADTSLAFTLLDTDGIQNRYPVQLALTAIADSAPQLRVRLEGISAAITPQARLPLIGSIHDDYGVARAWIEYEVGEQEPRQEPFSSAPTGRTELSVDEALDVRELGLQPGQKLLLGAKATDFHSLPGNDQPNVGQGERFLLDVVTPDALRAMLVARELNLRHRFETIMAELADTRDSLARLEFAETPPPGDSKGDPTPTRSVVSEEQEERPVPADEPPEGGDSPDRVRARRLLRVQRAMQNSLKEAEETRGVAISFDGIRAELVNNRIDTAELRTRLKDYIADPLKRIADRMFPDLDRRLDLLEKQLADDGAGAAARRTALEQADAILVEMQQVRDKMLELETFNEAVELLRQIIAAQQNVSAQTRKQRSEKVRSLLEDEE